MEEINKHEEWCYYCPNCRQIYFVTKNKSCRSCGTEMIETPHEYKLSQEIQKKISDKEFKQLKQNFLNDMVKKNNKFDSNLYENVDQMQKQNQQNSQSMQELSSKKRKLNLELLKLGIYSVQEITKEEYYEGIKNTPELYYTEKIYSKIENNNQFIYKKILTNKFSTEEINLLLRIQEGKDIKSFMENIKCIKQDINIIKEILKFFLTIFIISILVVILFYII